MKFPRPTRPIVAEELDADWSQMRAEFAPANAKLYNNLAFGPMQGTGGSTSVANSWDQLRSAAAASRAMLVAAAAQDWKVPASEITVHKGRLSHRSGKSGSFGQFAEKAAHLPLPGDVPLKDPAKFGLIGAKMPRINSTEKTTGKAIYAQDIRRPGMLTAVIARSPRFGGTVNSFDASGAKAVKGVVDVIAIPQGVAVLAENTWAAIRGRDALKVQWDESKAEHRSSAAMLDEYKKLAATPGAPALKKGDADFGSREMRENDRSGVFTFPYLAHAPMEPLNCTKELRTAAKSGPDRSFKQSSKPQPQASSDCVPIRCKFIRSGPAVRSAVAPRRTPTISPRRRAS